MHCEAICLLRFLASLHFLVFLACNYLTPVFNFTNVLVQKVAIDVEVSSYMGTNQE